MSCKFLNFVQICAQMWQIVNETVTEFFLLLSNFGVMMLYETKLVDLWINYIVNQAQINAGSHWEFIRKLYLFAILIEQNKVNAYRIISGDVFLFLPEGDLEVVERKPDFDWRDRICDLQEQRELLAQRADREVFI